MNTRPQPPRFTQTLLERALPLGPRTEAILGDLHEEFIRRQRTNPPLARWWYRREALSIALRFLLAQGRRKTHARTRTQTPITRPTGILMDQTVFNLKYAMRRLARSPFFAIVAISSLALGIGANTAIFSLVNAIILEKAPYEDPETLVDIYLSQPGFSHGTLSYPDYDDLLRGSSDVFSDIGGMQITMAQADMGPAAVEVLTTEAVTGNFFSLLGIKPALGRLISEEDHVARGTHPVVAIGYGFWQRHYGGGADVIGSELRLGGRPYTVIGVTPEDYNGTLRGLVPDLYVPIMMVDELDGRAGNTLTARGNQSFFPKGRLQSGATFAQAEAVAERVGNGIRAEHPNQWGPEKAFALIPTVDVIMNPMIDRVIVPVASMLMVVVGLVLLIACANLASFLLARAADRRKEIAVRLAMGATRTTLIGQLLTETILLSALGGVAGVALAVWSLRALTGADLPLPLPITLDLSLNGTILLFSIGVSLLAGVMFGLVPAIQSSNPALAPTLRDETAGSGRARGASLQNLLVVGQVAVSIVLLVAAGLFLRSLEASSQVQPGFGEAPTAMLEIVTPAMRYSEAEGRQYVRELEARIAELPGVQAVGLTDNIQMNSLSTQDLRLVVDGVEAPDGRDFHLVDYAEVDPGFLSAAGIDLISGRAINDTDLEDTEAVMMASETFVARFFPGGNAVGRTVRINGKETLVVGITRDTKVRQLGEDPRPYVYLAYLQSYSTYVTILARTTGDADRLAVKMFSEARGLDPEIMVVAGETVEKHLAIQLLPRRLGAMVVGGFAILALVLASIGLYGIVSFAVSRRSQEVGIRMSLGADSAAVVWMLTSSGLKLVLIGCIIGLTLAAILAQLLSTMLYGVQALDPVTFIGVPVLLMSVATLASWIPARRATLVSPVSALRGE